MSTQLTLEQQMTIEEFLAYTDSRPDGERWELIEGVAVMNPSPTNYHQKIAFNIAMALGKVKEASMACWEPILGIGTKVPVSPRSLPTPDVMVVSGPIIGTASPVTADAMIIFEVLSKSNTKADRAWRKRVYASVPNCQHYVTVSSLVVETVRHDQSDRWKGTRQTDLGDVLALPAIGVTIPIADIYRWTPLGRQGP